MKSKEEVAAEFDAWLATMFSVELTQTEFDALLEYSTTIPTGKAIGKQWKRQISYRSDWVLGEYVKDEDPEYVGISWKRITIKNSPIIHYTKPSAWPDAELTLEMRDEERAQHEAEMFQGRIYYFVGDFS